MMTSQPLDLFDLELPEFVVRAEKLDAQGYRPLSISQYGDPGNPLVASIWDQRPGPALRWVVGASVADFVAAYRQSKIEGFYPVLITATGLGAATRMTGAFEERPAAAQATELTVDQDRHAFASEVVDRAFHGWIPRCATIYDDPSSLSRVAAIWERNTGNVAWRAVAGLTEAQHQVHFEAQLSQWARPAYMTGSAGGRLLAVYRDDQVGPIGQGFVARYGLSLAAYEQERDHWHGQGLHQVCLQGYGTAADRRFAAIFVVGERPVQRVLRVAGSPAVPAIDQAVIDLMKASNIRGASLAIAQGTRLVLARAYTWAEPDYPQVQPTTTFRIASCSKLVAALGIHQLAAEGTLSLAAPLPDALPLTAPGGGPPINTAYFHTTVGGLLEYGGHFQRYESQGPAIAEAFGTPLPVTHEQIASYVTTMEPLPEPNDERLDDTGYFLAGQIIKRRRGTATLFGMPSLPVTEGGWRRCGKCQGLFSAPETCPAGGPHAAAGDLTYLLMRDSTFAFGQDGWRRCRNCRTLYFGDNGAGVCAVSGPHDPTGSRDYTLVTDSPYMEPQRNWRRCHNCQSLYYGGAGTSACPAGDTHVPIESPDYSIAPG